MKPSICPRCNNKVNSKNLGMELLEGMVCRDCYIKHLKELILNLEKFRKTNQMNEILSLRKKLLKIDEEMGNWHDVEHEGIIQSVDYYDEFDLTELREFFFMYETDIIKNLQEESNSKIHEELRLSLNKLK